MSVNFNYKSIASLNTWAHTYEAEVKMWLTELQVKYNMHALMLETWIPPAVQIVSAYQKHAASLSTLALSTS